MSKNKKVQDDEKNLNDQNLENSNEEIFNSEEENLVKVGHLENETAELKDKLLRKAAEFENYKRRTEIDQLNTLKYAAENFIIRFLPIVDDFERSLKHIETAEEVDSIKTGVKLIYEKLIKLLNEQGVKKIDAIGKPFDVEYHEAMLQRKDTDVEPHTVVDEIETGYLYKDRVIRHSKVIVSEESSSEKNEDLK